MNEKKISAREAKARFGIRTEHGIMPNGEARLRLIDQTGRGYIQTISTDESGWQNAHSHDALVEIYVVEQAWMGFCELDKEDKITWTIFKPGEIVQSAVGIPHNVYLPAKARIHTLKIFTSEKRDWHKHENLDALSKAMSENDLLLAAERNDNSTYKIETKELIKPLMDHYTNLDRLIWTIPTIFISAVAVVTGLMASITKINLQTGKIIWIVAFSLIFNSAISFIGYFSVHRLSYHHRIAGEEIYKMSGLDYFSKRNSLLSSRFWISSHSLGKYVMIAVSVLFLFGFFGELAFPRHLNEALFPIGKSDSVEAPITRTPSAEFPAANQKQKRIPPPPSSAPLNKGAQLPKDDTQRR